MEIRDFLFMLGIFIVCALVIYSESILVYFFPQRFHPGKVRISLNIKPVAIHRITQLQNWGGLTRTFDQVFVKSLLFFDEMVKAESVYTTIILKGKNGSLPIQIYHSPITTSDTAQKKQKQNLTCNVVINLAVFEVLEGLIRKMGVSDADTIGDVFRLYEWVLDNSDMNSVIEMRTSAPIALVISIPVKEIV